MSNNIFPEIREDKEKYPPQKNILCRQIFGNRFLTDQNLYEYMIEFLLIFVSAKDKNQNGKFQFHDLKDSEFNYYVTPRIGLKRFILYNYSKKDKSIPQDKDALEVLCDNLRKKMIDFDNDQEKNQILEAIQDFLHGYAVILRKRSWCAQAVLPLCPELIFCEASPNQRERKRDVIWDKTQNPNSNSIDTKFEYKQRNFLARGGELYYLHLLQGLNGDIQKKEELEKYLTYLLTNDTKKISNIANFIQNTWEETLEPIPLTVFSLDFIPVSAYKNCEQYAISELINFLSNQLPIVRRLDLLAKGIMFQVLRMMNCAITNYLELNYDSLPWVIDISNNASLKKFAHKNYKSVEESFDNALNKAYSNLYGEEDEDNEAKAARFKKIKQEKNSFCFGILKTKGKELHCIIPSNGAYERFSLSEDIISFLVLSIVPPEKQITFDMFLEKLYDHYNIIIGIKQFSKSSIYTEELENSLSKSFEENTMAFEKLLDQTGFLLELSDATSVVINPYKKINIQENE